MACINDLNSDLLNIILDYVCDDIEVALEKLEMRIKKLRLLILPLSIDTYNIYYNNAYYYIDKYLFDRIDEDIVVINDGMHFQNGYAHLPIYRSSVLKKPTYFEILVETNKSLVITGDFDHNVLYGLIKISSRNLNKYYGIKPIKGVSYYCLDMCP